MNISDFAGRVNAYLGGSEYGQSGNAPFDDALPKDVQELVADCVHFGREAASWMNQGVNLECEYYRARFNRAVALYGKELPTFGQWDLCWQIGYNSVRKESEVRS
jgi:hypothetical protein